MSMKKTRDLTIEYDTMPELPTDMNSMKESSCLFCSPSVDLKNLRTTIEKNIKNIVELETVENCLPANIAEHHIKQAFGLYKDLEKIVTVTENVDVEPNIDARSTISLLEVVYNLLLATKMSSNTVNIICDAPRQKLVKCFLDEDEGPILLEHYIKSPPEYRLNKSYCSLFVFDEGDLDSAAHYIATSFDDWIIPWRIASVYVQETCYDKFTEKLKSKLKQYPPEIVRDQVFLDNYQKGLQKIKELKATTICAEAKKSLSPKPTICLEFDREHFDGSENDILSPIVIMKKFRTTKEAINLAINDDGSSASVWTQNISLAYEMATKLTSQVVWINCIGILNGRIPFAFGKNSNCLGSVFSIMEFFRKYSVKNDDKYDPSNEIVKHFLSGCKNENSFHFEYCAIPDKYDCEKGFWEQNCLFKTIVFPFGVTFAN